MLTIRHALISDAAGLASLAEATFREAFNTDNSTSDLELHTSENFSFNIQRREILDPNRVTILAEIDHKFVGFAQVQLVAAKDCVPAKRPSELQRFYVSAHCHGRGVAPAIMAEVFTVAANAQSDGIWLGVWEHNPRAIAFYTKYDFIEVGEQRFQLGTDPQRDLVMAASVEASLCSN